MQVAAFSPRDYELRADEAMEILIAEGVDQQHTYSPNAPLFFVAVLVSLVTGKIIATFVESAYSSFASGGDQGIDNNVKLHRLVPFTITLAIAATGMILSLYLLSARDDVQKQKVDQKNDSRKKVMQIFSLYQDLNFHSPLSKEHIVVLLRETGPTIWGSYKIWNQLAQKMSLLQLHYIHQNYHTISSQDDSFRFYFPDKKNGVYRRPNLTPCEVERLEQELRERTEKELESWKALESTMSDRAMSEGKTIDEKMLAIWGAYYHCIIFLAPRQVEKSLDTFVIKHITTNNVVIIEAFGKYLSSKMGTSSGKRIEKGSARFRQG